MAILVILVIVLAMSLSFLLNAAIGASAARNTVDGMRAEYLADAAQNHAVWRLSYDTNLPTFAEAENADEFNMVNFMGHRYGYNFRPNTSTTMATVRTVGVAGDYVVSQAWLVNMKGQPFSGILALLGQNGNSVVQQLNFADPGFGNAVNGANVGSNTRWLRLAASLTQTKCTMMTIDDLNDVNLSIFDGSNWTTPWEFSTNTDKNYNCVDVAYESVSGDTMVIGRYTTGTRPYYSVWNGSTWTAPAIAPAYAGTASGDIRHLVLKADPKTSELILAYVTSGDDILGYVWNGTSWVGGQVVTATASSNLYQPLDIAYEQVSSDAIIVYGNSTTGLNYASWNGSSPGSGTVRTLGNSCRYVRMAAQPATDYLAAAVIDADNDLSICIWNGSSWSGAEYETTLYSSTMPGLAVAWESAGNEALIFYALSGQSTLSYRRYNKTTNSVGAAQTGPNFGAQIQTIQALTIPGEDRIIVLAGNSQNDLKYVLWGGSSFSVSTPVALDTDVYSVTQQSFAIASLKTN